MKQYFGIVKNMLDNIDTMNYSKMDRFKERVENELKLSNREYLDGMV